MSKAEIGKKQAKPVFVDNRNGNTLARAISAHLASLRGQGQTPAELCVASCYFNPQGLELIAGEARNIPRIRLLLGADPTPESMMPRRTPYDPQEPEFTRRRVNLGLRQLEQGLRQDRDLLPFDLEMDGNRARIWRGMKQEVIPIYRQSFWYIKYPLVSDKNTQASTPAAVFSRHERAG